MAFWMYPGKFSEQVSQQVGAASPRTCLRVNLKGAHWQRAGLYPRLHPRHFNVPLQPLLPFTALCDACGFSKQKMFMRRVYFRLPFMTAQTPLQADGLTVARKLFISQKQRLKFLFKKKRRFVLGAHLKQVLILSVAAPSPTQQPQSSQTCTGHPETPIPLIAGLEQSWRCNFFHFISKIGDILSEKVCLASVSV